MLFRLAVRGVLCFVGALSHDVEYKLGDSSGCETTTGWVSVDSYWECHDAMDRIDRFLPRVTKILERSVNLLWGQRR